MPRPVPAILTAASPSIDVVVRNPVPYATPPADLMPVIDAPPTPMVSLGPRGRYLALERGHLPAGGHVPASAQGPPT
jgi:hypothetical protein